jgi:OOP family OmpA-OmpF porin
MRSRRRPGACCPPRQSPPNCPWPSRRGGSGPVSLLALGAALFVGAPAYAQTTPAPQQGEFNVQRFEPTPGSNNFFTVAGARMTGNWGWSAGLLFNYQREPYVVRSCISQTNCSEPSASNTQTVPVVSDQLTWDIMASISPVKFLQVGLRVPLTYVTGAGLDLTDGSPAEAGVNAFGLGDPGVELKVRVLGDPSDPFVLGVAGDVAFPVGNLISPGTNLSNSSVSGGVRAILDGNFGPVSLGLNLRAALREDATIATTTIGPEFRYGAALGYRPSPIFRAFLEGFGGTRFSSLNGTNSLEALLGLEVAPLDSGLTIRAGGGAGILQGVGVPLARGIIGLHYSREDGDKDGDGIGDRDDKCPTVKEDFDKWEDDDGCPEDDNDRDKVPDATDKCPNVSETINGFQDEDGCPDDLPDRDKDGIQDSDDKCPDEAGKMRLKEWYGCPDKDGDNIPDKIDQCIDKAEDTDGFQDTDGCPEPDNDQDGILDEVDECIDQPEIKNGFKDEDGCPDEAPDKDKDGIPDNVDKCPNQPENLNGFEDDDGCPDKGISLVQITDDDIKILQKVEFATGSDKITGKTSFTVLDAVVSALKNNPQLFLVEVAGHTDNAGDATMNRTLSQKRAEACMKYIVDKGIGAHRLQAKGYGPDAPIADNKTGLGRQKNRRVEFKILKSTKKSPAPAPTPAPAPAAPAEPAKK